MPPTELGGGWPEASLNEKPGFCPVLLKLFIFLVITWLVQVAGSLRGVEQGSQRSPTLEGRCSGRCSTPTTVGRVDKCPIAKVTSQGDCV